MKFSILKKREKMYYQAEIVANKTNLRKVCELSNRPSIKRQFLKIRDTFMHTFMHNNKLITDLKSIADGFNNSFVNIGRTLASTIP